MVNALKNVLLARNCGTAQQKDASQSGNLISLLVHKLREFGDAEIPQLLQLDQDSLPQRPLFILGNMKYYQEVFQKIGGYPIWIQSLTLQIITE
jgi:hypothetical protein